MHCYILSSFPRQFNLGTHDLTSTWTLPAPRDSRPIQSSGIARCPRPSGCRAIRRRAAQEATSRREGSWWLRRITATSSGFGRLGFDLRETVNQKNSTPDMRKSTNFPTDCRGNLWEYGTWEEDTNKVRIVSQCVFILRSCCFHA